MYVLARHHLPLLRQLIGDVQVLGQCGMTKALDSQVEALHVES
jgi:hypothetical protein